MKFNREILDFILSLKSRRDRIAKTIEKFNVSDRLARQYSFLATNIKDISKLNLNAYMEGNRVLAIPDLHAPFIRYGYLEFCQEIYYKYRCNKVVFLGDLVDNHFSSYHETDPDGHGAGAELEKAKNDIQNWYKAFPVAKVCIGNHDAIPARKAMTSGLSASWIKNISEVLDTPNWEYAEQFIIDNNLYCHGIGRKARARAKDDLMSIIQGHYHGDSYIEHFVGRNYKIFAMQVSGGIDDKAYAMAYGRHFKKMHVNCGVILDNGELPILEFMRL